MRFVPIAVLLLGGCSLNALGQGSGTTEESPPDTSSTGMPSTSTSAPATSTTAVADDTSTTAMGTSDSTGTTGGTLACGEAPPAPDGCSGSCDGCEMGECALVCLGTDICQGSELECPPDRPCYVRCNGPGACRQAVITCPAQHACRVDCFGVEACADVQLHCGAGPCTLECNTSPVACSALDFHCGSNDSQITCNALQDMQPVLHESDSECACDKIGCEMDAGSSSGG